jgi:thiol-disulfide isomerase/thioredoxin
MRLFSLLFLLCCVLACPKPTPVAATMQPTRLPTVAVQSTDGSSVVLQEKLAGSVAVVDLWAGWCTACKDGMPALERLSRSFAAAGLVVVGLNVGEPMDKAKKYASELGVTYPLYFDPEFAFADSMGANKLPALFVLTRSGEIAYRGSVLNEEVLRVIRELLSEKK